MKNRQANQILVQPDERILRREVPNGAIFESNPKLRELNVFDARDSFPGDENGFDLYVVKCVDEVFSPGDERSEVQIRVAQQILVLAEDQLAANVCVAVSVDEAVREGVAVKRLELRGKRKRSEFPPFVVRLTVKVSTAKSPVGFGGSGGETRLHLGSLQVMFLKEAEAQGKHWIQFRSLPVSRIKEKCFGGEPTSTSMKYSPEPRVIPDSRGEATGEMKLHGLVFSRHFLGGFVLRRRETAIVACGRRNGTEAHRIRKVKPREARDVLLLIVSGESSGVAGKCCDEKEYKTKNETILGQHQEISLGKKTRNRRQ
ncbi:unnamed protein product [Thlaspi arvense]|uniref:Uncharacterized protein n=1 Tax=Thlaspi arvense TaxID=13288 RepID=A0AAU9SG36_THLAR|nr:unnamed protein product [Thlaspi arvense]